LCDKLRHRWNTKDMPELWGSAVQCTRTVEGAVVAARVDGGGGKQGGADAAHGAAHAVASKHIQSVVHIAAAIVLHQHLGTSAHAGADDADEGSSAHIHEACGAREKG
jgi:hypothetical protein